MVPKVTVVMFSFVSVYSTLLAVLPTATAPKLIGAAGVKRKAASDARPFQLGSGAGSYVVSEGRLHAQFPEKVFQPG